MRPPSGRGSRGGRRLRADDAYAPHGTYGRERTGLVGGSQQPEYRADPVVPAYGERGDHPQGAPWGGPAGHGGPGYEGSGYDGPGYDGRGYGGPGYGGPVYGSPGNGGQSYDGGQGYWAGGYGDHGSGAPGGYGAAGYWGDGNGDGRYPGPADRGDAAGSPYGFDEQGPGRRRGPDYPRHRPVRRRRYRRGRGAVRRFPAIPAPVLAALAFVLCVVLVLAGVGLSRMTTARTGPVTTVAANSNCTLIVPENPLSPEGLATPYLLTATNPAQGACHEANLHQTAFVQAAIINATTGQISVYDPLVIDKGTTPVAAPVLPKLPLNSVVALWFGYNGNNLTLAGADQMEGPSPSLPMTMYLDGSDSSGGYEFPASAPTSDFLLQQADCVAGEDINGRFSTFTQVGACNTTAFFTAAEAAVAARKLKVPNPGTAADGRNCLTTRSFALVDQDQGASVSTEYLAEPGGQTAQDTAANRQALTGASALFNGSDSELLDLFVDPALRCRPWVVPNQTDGGALTSALPLDELQAAVWAGKQGSGPVALVPLNDPMTLDTYANFNTGKANAYRANVDMPPLPAGESPGQYCTDLERIQGSRLQEDVNLLTKARSPKPGAADNLFTFMALRLKNSFVDLDCASTGQANDVSTTENSAGVVVEACFADQVAPLTPGAGNPMAGRKTCPATTG